MLRRATPDRSPLALLAAPVALAGFMASAILVPGTARAAADSASAPAPIKAPITPSPGAQVPGGVGLNIADAVQLTLTRNERGRISDLNVGVADAAVEKARAGL